MAYNHNNRNNSNNPYSSYYNGSRTQTAEPPQLQTTEPPQLTLRLLPDDTPLSEVNRDTAHTNAPLSTRRVSTRRAPSSAAQRPEPGSFDNGPTPLSQRFNPFGDPPRTAANTTSPSYPGTANQPLSDVYNPSLRPPPNVRLSRQGRHPGPNEQAYPPLGSTRNSPRAPVPNLDSINSINSVMTNNPFADPQGPERSQPPGTLPPLQDGGDVLADVSRILQRSIQRSEASNTDGDQPLTHMSLGEQAELLRLVELAIGVRREDAQFRQQVVGEAMRFFNAQLAGDNGMMEEFDIEDFHPWGMTRAQRIQLYAANSLQDVREGFDRAFIILMEGIRRGLRGIGNFGIAVSQALRDQWYYNGAAPMTASLVTVEAIVALIVGPTNHLSNMVNERTWQVFVGFVCALLAVDAVMIYHMVRGWGPARGRGGEVRRDRARRERQWPGRG